LHELTDAYSRRITQPSARADGATTANLLKPHELKNIIEGETEVLRTINERHSINHGWRIQSHTGAAMWDNQQMPALVMPYCF
jgi:hypothetical protein